jgi:hypothetical protein
MKTDCDRTGQRFRRWPAPATTSLLSRLFFVAVFLAAAAGGLPFAAVGAEPPAASADEATLAVREQQLAEQFQELEKTFLRLADLLAASDPRRATLLRSVFEQARQQEVGDRLGRIVELLEKGQLLKAGASQANAVDRLRMLLDLLESGDDDRRLANTKAEVKQFLARLAKTIARQRDIEGSTEAGADAGKLAERQEALSEETKALSRDVGAFAKRMDARGGEPPAGTPPDGKKPEADPAADPGSSQDSGSPENSGSPQKSESPPGDAGPPQSSEGQSSEGQPAAPEGDDESSRAERTRQRLEAAERRMEAARERLERAERRDARGEQEQAVEELETARAELEEILRQMREEEIERLLVQLETRLRAMLRAERAILAGCEKLAGPIGSNQAAGGKIAADREAQLEAARLGREQAGVGNDASKALLLVRDDGGAVAIPEALEQIRDDAAQAAVRLGRGDVGGTTRGIVQDLVTNLEEMLAALEKAKQNEQQPQQGGAGGRPAEPGEQPLVDKLSELKMIRSLQMRVNTRTRRFSQLLAEGVEQAEEPELAAALARLAERQRKIERAARDIVGGRTE